MLSPVIDRLCEFPKKLLFFSLEDWNDVWRRNQFFCAGLLDKHPDLEILWICPPHDALHELRKGAPSERQLGVGKLLDVAEHSRVKLLKPLKLLPNALSRSFNEFYYRQQITKALKDLGWSNYTIWLNDQKCRSFVTLPAPIVYDITDDWTEFAQSDRERNRVKLDDGWCMAHANAVIVCSDELLRKKHTENAAVHLIRNGVDHNRYHPSVLATTVVAPDIELIRRPIAGYTGTLHSERLDLDLVINVATACPEVSFVFVGPNCLSKAECDRLSPLKNVHLLGSKSYAELPSYVVAFDVCITPHRITSFTESLDPLKLYEYMSTGKPIVSTACAGFRDLNSVISIATDQTEFSKMIRLAIKNRNELAEQRLRWARECSWDERIKQVENVLGWQ